MFYKTGRTLSPLEVQLNGTLWMPASINFNADHAGDPIQRGSCKFDPKTKLPTCTNWTRGACSCATIYIIAGPTSLQFVYGRELAPVTA
jgi:hypothetical protein